MEGLELASRVTTDAAYDFSAEGTRRIAVYDYGVKLNILRVFEALDCAVRVFPATAPLREVMAWNPDGIFFSNGPGDPRAMPGAIETVRRAIETKLPLLGICLGHQLMSLAAGLEVCIVFVGHSRVNQREKHIGIGVV